MKPENVKIFISYARKDGRDLAVDLERDLDNAGYEVSRQDTNDILGGADWSREVQDELDSSDMVVALLSQGSLESKICTCEHLRAERKGKPIIPVLVQPDVDPPLYLERLQYLDFSDGSQYPDRFEALLKAIKGDKKAYILTVKRGKVTAPVLPNHFIARPEDLDGLRSLVMRDGGDRKVGLSALRGLGGIGKSVLAQALCHDEAVQDAFPDGVLWVEIGREPGSLTEHMKTIGTSLGDAIGYYTSEVASGSRLREILPTKAALIVLDDVWEVKHVEVFLADAPRCRVLFTTRNPAIGEELGAEQMRLDVLEPAKAVELLQQWAGREDSAFGQIADELGYLPLALKLAGARLAKRPKMSGAEWLGSFERISQLKANLNPKDVHDSVELCFEASLEELDADYHQLYFALGIFAEDVRIPERVATRLWMALNPELDEGDCEDLTLELAQLALIERDREETITLHDLLHDFTKERLGDKYQGTQEALLKAYNPDDKAWYEVDDDGYLYVNVAYHLIEAGRQGELYDLLTGSPEWMEKKFVVCVGDWAYDADLELAIGQFSDPLDAKGVLTVSELWAARQVVNARTDIYTDKDLEILVWLGYEKEALAQCWMRQDIKKKAQGLQVVYYATKEKTGLSKTDILLESYRICVSAEDAKWRAKALSDIAKQLAQAGQFNETLDIAHTIEDVNKRAIALSDIAIYLAQAGQFNQALHVAHTIDDGIASNDGGWGEIFANWDDLVQGTASKVDADNNWGREQPVFRSDVRSDTLYDIAKHLAQAGQFNVALDVARTIENTSKRADTLCDIAKHLAQANDPTSQQVFRDAFDIAHTIENASKRADALRDIAKHLAQAGQFNVALDVAHTIENASKQADALSDIVKHLAQAGQFNVALDVAHTIENASKRADALSDIAKHLARAGQLNEALDIVHNIIDDTVQWRNTISDIVQYLVQVGEFNQALNVARLLDDGISANDSSWGRKRRASFFRADALNYITKHLIQAGHFNVALDVAHTIENASKRADALSDIAKQLAQANDPTSQQVFQEALDVAHAIENASKRANTLCDIAIYLAQAGQFNQALHVTHTLEDEVIDNDRTSNPWGPPPVLRFRSDALSHITKQLAQAGQFNEALDVAHAIGNASKRANALCDIAIYLAQAGQLNQALDVAHAIENASKRADTLSIIAKYLAQAGQFNEALDVISTIDDDVASNDGGWGEINVANWDDLVQETSSNIDADNNWSWEQPVFHSDARSDDTFVRSDDTLSDIAKQLAQAGQFNEALDVAHTIENVSKRANALSDIAIYLAQAGQFNEVLVVISAIDDSRLRTDTLSNIAKSLAQVGQLNEVVNVLLTIFYTTIRENTLSFIAAHYNQDDKKQSEIPFSSPSNYEKVISDVAKHLAQVNQIKKALDVAHNIRNDQWHADTLGSISAHLAQTGHLNEALNITNTISDTWRKADALSAIAAHLAQKGQHNEALNVAYAIGNTKKLADVLSDIAKYLAEMGQFDEALSIARTFSNKRQIEALSIISLYLAQANDPTSQQVFNEALGVAHTIDDAVTQAEALSTIGLHLVQANDPISQQVFNKALEVAHAIDDAEQRGNSLSNIAKHLAQAGYLDDSFKVLLHVEADWQQVDTLCFIAMHLAQQGQLNEALSVASSIDNTWKRADVLSHIAKRLAQTNDPMSQQVFNEALATARIVDDTVTQMNALSTLALCLAQADQLSQALDIVHTIDDTVTQMNALSTITSYLAQAGHVSEALTIAYSIGDSGIRASTLSSVASEFAQRGQQSKAYEILGSGNSSGFLESVVKWAYGFETIKTGLTVQVLVEVLHILGWHNQYWRELYEQLAADEAA